MTIRDDITINRDDQGVRIDVNFHDNSLVPLLYGEHDTNLVRIETALDVSIMSRGNTLIITGKTDAINAAEAALLTLWNRLQQGMDVDAQQIDAAMRMTAIPAGTGQRSAALAAMSSKTNSLTTKRKQITPRSPNQAIYMDKMSQNDLVFGLGPAGTGKTYLAVAQAVSMMISGKIDRIILSRPAVEAGERLGFLPGDLRDKVDPYLRPLYDALYDMLPADQVEKKLANGEIEIAPLAFMRGRTLSNAFVILDEAQNTSTMQMKMFLTRLGDNSRMVITGDISQIDLPGGVQSGLKEALHILEDVKGVGVTRFQDEDVVRHALVARIVKAYDAFDRKRKGNG